MSKKIKHKHKTRRKKQYDLLRGAGYTSYEASRFKDFSDYKIKRLIDEREQANIRVNEIAGGK